MAGDNFQEREKRRGVSGESTNENGSHRKKGVIPSFFHMQCGPSDSPCAAFIATIQTKYPLTCQPAS